SIWTSLFSVAHNGGVSSARRGSCTRVRSDVRLRQRTLPGIRTRHAGLGTRRYSLFDVRHFEGPLDPYSLREDLPAPAEVFAAIRVARVKTSVPTASPVLMGSR